MKATYDERYLLNKFNNKKRSCDERMIKFKFSQQEWLYFHKLLYNGVKCAYSNMTFIFKDHHMHSPSIERIDDNRPYTVYNCIWVTKQSNGIKDHIVSGGTPEDLSNQTDTFLARRIQRILESEETLREIRKPYLHLYEKSNEQGGNEVTESTTTKGVPHNNTEIDIAKQYCVFGDFIESKCDHEFNLTYTQFKRLIQRKKCQLTQRDMDNPSLFVLDKTLPVDKSNVLVCDKSLSEALDTMIVSAKLTTKDLMKLAKTLSK